MRLLILTQTVDSTHPILGFFHRWLEEISKRVESIVVICLKEGEHNLPLNVRVFSLGKEGGESRIKYIYNFYRLVSRERRNYDVVFVHMNQIYVLLGGLLWKLWHKPIVLWYVHKQVSISLRFAVLLVDKVFSTNKESFRIETKKLVVTNHGIDTELFSPGYDADPYAVITSGRISRTKNIHFMVDAISKVPEARFAIVGKAITNEERVYEKQLRTLVEQLGLESRVTFTGARLQSELATLLKTGSIFLNLSNTGSMDKALLEAASTGLYTITSNESLREVADCFLETSSPDIVSLAITQALTEHARGKKRAVIVEKHNVVRLIDRIVRELESLVA